MSKQPDPTQEEIQMFGEPSPLFLQPPRPEQFGINQYGTFIPRTEYVPAQEKSPLLYVDDYDEE